MRRIFTLGMALLATLGMHAQEKTLKAYSLKEAVDYAVSNNNDAKNAKLDEAKAKARNKEIIATGLPQVSASVDYNYYFKTPIVPALSQFFNDTTSATSRVFGYLAQNDPNIANLLYQSSIQSKDQEISFVLPHSLGGSLQVTQLLFDARYMFGIRATKDLIKTSRLSREMTDIEVKYSVTKAYYQARSAQQANAMMANTLVLIQKLLGETRETFKQGLIEELDVDRLELIEANLKSQIAQQKRMEEVAFANLKFQMGLPLNEEILLTDDLESLLAQAGVRTEAGSFDVTKRVEYELLNTAIKLQGYDIAQKRSGYYPSLVAFLNYGWTAQSQTFEGMFKNTTQYYPDGDSRKISPWFDQGLVGIKLNLPIFDSGSRMAQVKQAKLEQQKATNNANNFKNAAELQYRVAYSSFTNALEEETNNKRSVDLSQKIFNTNRIKYQNGVGSSFELEQSEQDLITNQLKSIQSTLNLLTSKADLDKALGIK